MSTPKKPKLRILRVPNPQTPLVIDSDEKGVLVFVHEAGNDRKGAKFFLPFWQFKRFTDDVRTHAKRQAQYSRRRADQIEIHCETRSAQ
jgi:hypothetical protein